MKNLATFLINDGCWITKTCTSFHYNRDIFYDEILLKFFININAKPYERRLRVRQRELNNRTQMY